MEGVWCSSKELGWGLGQGERLWLVVDVRGKCFVQGEGGDEVGMYWDMINESACRAPTQFGSWGSDVGVWQMCIAQHLSVRRLTVQALPPR